jgi:hypothetical protein
MSDALLSKLQFKNHSPVLVLQSPPEFKPVLAHWKKLAEIDTEVNPKKQYAFSIAFVQSAAEVKKLGLPIAQKMVEDGIFWMAYPKKTSKKYRSAITRDEGWEALGDAGFEVVRMVAVDEDWSAVRFRKAAFIGKMIRRQEMAMSTEGKQKTVNKTNKAIRSGKS